MNHHGFWGRDDFFVLSPMTTGRVVFPGPTSAEVVAQVLEAVAELRSTWLESDFSRLFNWGGDTIYE